MNLVDERLSAAVDDLRQGLEHTETPSFAPKRRLPAAAAVVLIALCGIAALAVWANRGSSEDDAEVVEVATQPETDQEPGAQEPTDSGESAPVETAPSVEPSRPAVVSGALVDARPGEFIVPLPGVSAWNAGETLVLLYRTGSADPEHLIVDARTREVVAVLPFTPPDIEQIYWSQVDPSQLFYAEGNQLLTFDLDTMTSQVVHTFTDCDRVGSGTLPVPPSADGVLFGMQCYAGSDTTMVVLDVADGSEVRLATQSDTAPIPSPSGDRVVVLNPDGSATVLDRRLANTGVTLDLNYDRFTFVVDAEGREWAAAALYTGDPVGSLVLLPLDGLDPPRVAVGPATGFAYPPPGTQLSSVGNLVAVSIDGTSTGLAGSIHLVDTQSQSPGLSPIQSAVEHQSLSRHDYWSNPVVSLSPSARYIVYASDRGSDRVTTYIHDFGTG